ncbi:MAG: cyclic nucleotide-binding domain-containing protein [Gammaproteobacteria bacterium]|nr:cyclic nucleotide-binding domain-containing protein [Gammaproteobacteria bacterium]
MKNKLKTFLNVEPGEEKLVALNFLQSIFVGLPKLFTLMTANALFLEHYSADNLPYIYLVSSSVVPVVGFIHLHFEKKISYVKLQAGTLLTLSLISLSFLILLWIFNAIWLIVLLYIWLAVELVMTDIVLWGTANRLFTARQSKRLFGLIGAGAIVAVVVGGFFTPYFVALVGTQGLLLFSLGGFLLALGNFLYMSRLYKSKFIKAPQKTEQSEIGEQSGSAMLQSRYLLLVFLLFAFFSQVIYLFVDNIFYMQMGEKYPDADQLAAFIGQFWAVYGLLSLSFRFLAAGRWMANFGILGGLLISQSVVGICVILIIASSILNLSAELIIIFWLIAATKQLDNILTGSITSPAYLTLYQPLSQERRTRVQTVSESIAAPVGRLLTSLLLLLLAKYLDFSTVGLCVALLVIIFAYIGICFITVREYRNALTKALSRGGLVGADLSLDDPETPRILEKGLESHRSKEVLYCLKLLEEAKHPELPVHLGRLAGHADPEVREGVYQTAERLGLENCHAFLEKRLAAEDSPRQLAALLRALAATGDVFDVIETYLDDERPEVRQGAMVALIRHCDIEGAVRAGGALMAFQRSDDAREREFAAVVLGQIGVPAFYRALSALLRDKNHDVRKAALNAAILVNNCKLWPAVVESLSIPPLREAAARTLRHAGEPAFAALESAYENPHCATRIRREVIRLYGRIKSGEALALLRVKLDSADRDLRYEILLSLYLCGYQAGETGRTTIDKFLKDEAAYGERILAALESVKSESAASLLSAALAYELEKTRERTFLLLSTVYSAELIMKIWRNFKGASSKKQDLAKRDLAIELLDNTVGKEHKSMVLPLLEAQLIPPRNPFEQIIEIIASPEIWDNTWTRVCAIDAAAEIVSPENLQLRSRLSLLANDADPLLKETAQSVLAKQARTDRFSTLESVRILKSAAIFSEIPDEILAKAVPFLEHRDVDASEIVFQKGELGTCSYIIARGRLRVHDGEKTLAILGKGHIFGELAALDPEPRMASVTGLEKSCLFRLSQEELHSLMESHIEMAKGIIQVLCLRLRASLAGIKQDSPPQTASSVVSGALAFQQEDQLSLIEKIIILKTVSIFADTPDNILSEVAALSRESYLNKDRMLFRKGDMGASLYIVVSGRVRVHDDARIIAELGERSLIGEMAVLSSEPRTASITAITDTSLLSLSQDSLFELMRDQHKIVSGIIQVLIRRLRASIAW